MVIQVPPSYFNLFELRYSVEHVARIFTGAILMALLMSLCYEILSVQ